MRKKSESVALLHRSRSKKSVGHGSKAGGLGYRCFGTTSGLAGALYGWHRSI